MILNENVTIKKLLENLENGHERIAFLVNDQKKLISCVTQGDIIRALIDGVSLKVSAKEISRLNPKVVMKEKGAQKKAIELIISNKLHAVPIINKNGSIHTIVSIQNIYEILDKNNL